MTPEHQLVVASCVTVVLVIIALCRLAAHGRGRPRDLARTLLWVLFGWRVGGNGPRGPAWPA